MIRAFKYLCITALLCLSHPTWAQGGQEVQANSTELEQLRQQIKQYEEEIRISTELLNKTQKDRSASESQLKIIRTQLTNRRNMIRSLEKQVGVIEEDINKKNRDIGRLGKELEKLKKDYGAMVYAAYKNYKLNNFILFLFSSEDFNMASRRADFMRRYNRARMEKAGQITHMADSIQGEVSKLDATKHELDVTRQTHSKEVVSLGKDEKQYKTTVDKLSAEQQKLQQDVKQKQALFDQAQRHIQDLVAAEVRRSQVDDVSDADLRAIAELSGRFDENKGKLPYPIAGGVIIDRYGEHAHQLVSSTRVKNPGINIAGQGGSPVNCVFEGKVMEIVSIPTYNRCILVRHGNYITVYANLVSVNVRKGATVKAGQMLGRIDNNANDDNNFLHFEIHKETETLNPEQWLRR